MDFAFTEAQKAVSDLARKIFTERVTQPVLKSLAADEDRFYQKLWCDLADAGLLGTAIPEADGGSGHGLRELSALLEEAGAAVAPVPLWETLVLGALPIAELGTPEQRQRFLPGIVAGETILTAALAEPASIDPLEPATTAKRAGDGWSLTGVKCHVPSAQLAASILVPARTSEEEIGVFLVDPRGAGAKLARQITTTGEPEFVLTLDGAFAGPADVIGDPSKGAAVVDWIHQRALAGLCAMELGVAARALKMTAEYTSQRQQFDRPIATFQAVAQRAADAFIDVESIRLSTYKAIFRLAEGLPAAESVAIAKFWAAEAGHRVVYAAQHLHGGIGFDADYPLYRYYLLSKKIELTLGSASVQLARIGRGLARS